jgi:hypothetical protein
MVSKRTMVIINIALALMAIVLLLHLFGVKIPSVGHAIYVLDTNDPVCVVESSELNTVPDLNRCCLEASKQVECFRESTSIEQGDVHWICHSGSGNHFKYRLNNKAYQFCLEQPYWQ